MPAEGGSLAFAWRRTSAYSVAAHDAQGPTDYAVSRALVLDRPGLGPDRTLKEVFTAWFGPNLLDQPRETSSPAKILGVRATAEGTKALCAEHAAAHPRVSAG